MKALLLLLTCLPALLFAQDWKTAYRSAVAVDIYQTHWLKEHGYREFNPNLRGAALPTALLQVWDCEWQVFLIDRLPRDIRPIVGYAALLIRIQPVLANARKGIQPRATIPLFSIRFRS